MRLGHEGCFYCDHRRAKGFLDVLDFYGCLRAVHRSHPQSNRQTCEAAKHKAKDKCPFVLPQNPDILHEDREIVCLMDRSGAGLRVSAHIQRLSMRTAHDRFVTFVAIIAARKTWVIHVT